MAGLWSLKLQVSALNYQFRAGYLLKQVVFNNKYFLEEDLNSFYIRVATFGYCSVTLPQLKFLKCDRYKPRRPLSVYSFNEETLLINNRILILVSVLQYNYRLIYSAQKTSRFGTLNQFLSGLGNGKVNTTIQKVVNLKKVLETPPLSVDHTSLLGTEISITQYGTKLCP